MDEQTTQPNLYEIIGRLVAGQASQAQIIAEQRRIIELLDKKLNSKEPDPT